MGRWWKGNGRLTSPSSSASEGGFATEEVEAAQAAGIQAITLGKRILRAETAALVAAALVLYELDQM